MHLERCESFGFNGIFLTEVVVVFVFFCLSFFFLGFSIMFYLCYCFFPPSFGVFS